MSYEPKPIDNSGVELSEELRDLVEMLARNNHELWAKGRQRENWAYGEVRDGEKKTTPLYLPYDELPESEKQFDRQNVTETLKTFIRLGASIQFKPAGDVAEKLAFKARVRRLNAAGESLMACDIADEGLREWPNEPSLRLAKALALARMGSLERAEELLRKLRNEAGDDEEVLGMLARIRKDIWLKTGIEEDLKAAAEAYDEARRHAPDRYWSVINAATLAFALGDQVKASQLANEARGICLAIRASHAGIAEYWVLATLAEAALLLDDPAEAISCYEQAGECGKGAPGDVLSTWRNAAIILRFRGAETEEAVRIALRVPTVAVLETGGYRGAEDDEAVATLGDSIAKHLVKLNVRTGYMSGGQLAAAAFAKALRESGGKTHIVLPCGHQQFLDASGAGKCLVEELEKADEIIVPAEGDFNAENVAYADGLVAGLAAMNARRFGTRIVRFVVRYVDMAADQERTAPEVSETQTRSEYAVSITIFRSGAGTQSKPSEAKLRVPGVTTETRALLFADAKHFSHLNEGQMATFIREFMKSVGMLAEEFGHRILFHNTWGDGLFFVFQGVTDAARFALRLSRRTGNIDRKASGLPEELRLRIALHAGPVHCFRDQVTGRINYFGTHVNKAARIEPMALPGRVFVSDAFAAMATTEAPGQFRFDYVGRVPLAKQFGEHRLYDMCAVED